MVYWQDETNKIHCIERLCNNCTCSYLKLNNTIACSNLFIRWGGGGGQFRSVENTKYLGVTISSDLSWGKHVFAPVNKANIVLGIIKRSIGTNNRDVFSQLYKSLVRPILEYAAPVWSPYLIKDIVALEKVQRRASRLALR